MDEAAATAAFQKALAQYGDGFGQFFLARLLDLDISYGEQTCEVSFVVSDWMFNPQGSLHGGIIATVLDISMGHLLKQFAGAGTTLEMKVQYARAARAGGLRCHAGFLRQGRTISLLESRMRDAEGKLVAAATSTWQMLGK